jgi:hypothetical protein
MSEPNPDMDKLLKAYAKKRKAEGGQSFELHPATRKMLQGEVSRVRGKASAAPEPKPKIRLWPALAWTAATCAIVAIGIVKVSNRHSDSSMQVAMSELQPTPAAAAPMKEERAAKFKDRDESSFARQLDAEKTVADSKSQGKNPAQSAHFSERSDGFVAKAEEQKAKVSPPVARHAEFANAAPAEVDRGVTPAEPTSPAPASDAAPRALRGERRKGELDNTTVAQVTPNLKPERHSVSEDIQTTNGLQIVAPSAAPPISAESVATASLPAPDITGSATNSPREPLLAGGVSQQQMFVQRDSRSAYRVNLQSPPLPKVLTKFSVIRTGDKVRVIDADGSVYEGSVVTTVPAKTAVLATPRGQAAADVSGGDAKDGESYAFKVSGRSRTLNKIISFQATNLLARVDGGTAKKLNESAAANGVATRSLSLAKEASAKIEAKPTTEGIRGWVNVGKAVEFQIEASEVK